MIFSSIFFILMLLIILLYLKFKNYIPILMYHRIADVPGDRNALPLNKFCEQMDYLNNNRFTTITMEMLYDFYANGKKLPKKSVLLTFDDGYMDNFTAALPILKERNMTAAVFPISNWIGKENKWEDFNKEQTVTMDWNQLKAWQDAGMEIASHTSNHPFLGHTPIEQTKLELTESKEQLEKNLQCKIDFLCYPYGSFNVHTCDVAKAAGYKGAFAIFDRVPLWHINLFALPRIPIPSRQSMLEFKLKVSRIHVIFIAMRKWERNFKRWLRKK